MNLKFPFAGNSFMKKLGWLFATIITALFLCIFIPALFHKTGIKQDFENDLTHFVPMPYTTVRSLMTIVLFFVMPADLFKEGEFMKHNYQYLRHMFMLSLLFELDCVYTECW